MQISNSLAAKQRPHTLDEVVGQTTAVALIRGYLKREQIPNVILFVGVPGTGKTTLARVISNEVNYIKPGEKDTDCYEANMASERGIDDARNLMATAKFLPKKNLRFIILDEVQGATPQAANSMLKMLEEPPKHTTWILCTTDPDKLLPAVLSRCDKIKLVPYTVDQITEMLVHVAKKEKLFPKQDMHELYEQIAVNTGLVPRDSINLLGQIAILHESGNFKSHKALLKAALANNDIGDNAVATRMLMCLYLNNKKAGMKVIRQTTNSRSMLDTMLHINQACIDSLAYPKKWYTVAQNSFFDLAKENSVAITLPKAMHIHSELGALKSKLFYGADELNVVLGGICAILLNDKTGE